MPGRCRLRHQCSLVQQQRCKTAAFERRLLHLTKTKHHESPIERSVPISREIAKATLQTCTAYLHVSWVQRIRDKRSRCFEGACHAQYLRRRKIYAPEWVRNDSHEYKEVKFKKIGIQDATTFKGFCLGHDSLFESLDNYGIVNFRDLILQIYRCLGSDFFSNLTRRESEIHALGKSLYFNDIFEEGKSFGTTTAMDLFYDLINDFPGSLAPLPKKKKLNLEFFSNLIEGKATVLVRPMSFGCQVALQKKFQLHKNGTYFDTFRLCDSIEYRIYLDYPLLQNKKKRRCIISW